MVIVGSNKAIPDPAVLFTSFDNGEALLLHLGTSTYYSLNVTGSHIWQLMSRGLSFEEIGSELGANFKVTVHDARQCVIELADQLTSEALVRLVKD